MKNRLFKPRYKHKLHLLAGAFLTLQCLPLSAMDIPANKEEARIALAGGLLDSARWALICPYYAQPLTLTVDGLTVLQELFPEDAQAIEDARNDLDPEKHWTPARIDLFFNRHPGLAAYRPLLACSDYVQGARGSAGITSTWSDKNIQTPSSAWMSVTVPGNIALSTSFDITETSIRLRRRTLRWSLAPGMRITAGNIIADLDRGLITGRHTRPSGDTTQWTDLLYGNTSGMNGLSLETAITQALDLPAYIHWGQREQDGGVQVRRRVNRHFSWKAGATAYRTNLLPGSSAEGMKTGAAINGEITLSGDCWKGGMAWSLVNSDTPSVPFRLSVARKTDPLAIELVYTRLPADGHLAASAARQRIGHELSPHYDSTAHDLHALAASCHAVLPLNMSLIADLDMSIAGAGEAMAAQSEITVAGKGFIAWRSGYSLKANGPGGTCAQRLFIEASSVKTTPLREWLLQAAGSIMFTESSYSGATIRLGTVIPIIAGSLLEPGVCWTDSRGRSRWSVGLRQSLSPAPLSSITFSLDCAIPGDKQPDETATRIGAQAHVGF